MKNIYEKISLIITLLSICLFAQAQNPDKKTSTQGEFDFEVEEHDFGKIKEGEIAYFVFKFKNIGKSPIVIQDVKASCGCTIPEKPSKPVLPNQSSSIKVKFNSKDRPGGFYKTITITSNASEATKQLKIKGFVSKD